MTATVPIVYNAGAYGTYVEWCLTTLCSDSPISAPFRVNGNSHEFQGNFLPGMQGWQQYQSGNSQHQFVRFHPKTSVAESLSDNLNEILRSVNHLVYLYPDRDHMLLVINNYLSKCYDNWWLTYFSHYIDQSVIFDNWPVKGLDISQIPTWVRREFLSLYLMPCWFDQVEWYHLDRWAHPRSYMITIKDLLYNFESVMTGLESSLGLTFAKPISDLLSYHEKNLSLQINQTQDQVCKKIIDSVIDQVDYDWSNQPLPLASEAYVQWQLRNLGFEIKCDKLDKFPSNSVHLKELLYTI